MPDGSGPPDKFPMWIDVVGKTPSETADTLGKAWEKFNNHYGVWPNAWVTVGTVVYIGAYGK